MQVRVATYNYHSPGIRTSDSMAMAMDNACEQKPLGQRLAAGQVLRELDGDIVSFQGVEKGPFLRAELDREVPGRYQTIQSLRDDNRFDVALASRAQIVNVVTPEEHQVLGHDLLGVDLELPGGVPLRVFTVDFQSHDAAEAYDARSFIKESVRTLSHKNYIVMGHFGDTADSPTARLFTDFDGDGWGLVDAAAQLGNSTGTYPTTAAGEPLKASQRLDFILTSPELADKLTSVSVHRTPAAHIASDHFPLTATFTL